MTRNNSTSSRVYFLTEPFFKDILPDSVHLVRRNIVTLEPRIHINVTQTIGFNLTVFYNINPINDKKLQMHSPILLCFFVGFFVL